MGNFEKEGDHYIYRQENGEITARLRSTEEKMVLSHEGSPFYIRVFNLLVLAGALYLTLVFILT
jgi:hypothetical protein